jgi:prephenate dehydrogenase
MGLKSQGHEVLGWDLSAKNLETSKKKFAIDHIVEFEDCAEADVVFVAVPPADVIPISEGIERHRGAETIVTDCCSIKQEIADWAKAKDFFVPGHPMAGHEKGGPEYASLWMFRNAKWILCPANKEQRANAKEIQPLVESLGAKVVRIEAQEHDRAVGVRSHLPHILAAILLEIGQNSPQVGAGSWKDLTRVAGVDPNLWTQILTGNKKELSKILDEFSEQISRAKSKLDSENETKEWLNQVAKLKSEDEKNPK